MSEPREPEVLDDGAEVEAQRAIRERKRQSSVRELRTQVRVLERENERLDTENVYLLGLEAHQPKPFRIRPRSKRENASGKNHCLPVLLASDWHMGERVRPETVNGLNEYSPEIAEERARAFFRNAHRLIDIQRGGATITEALLWLGGDLMTGYIHEEFEEENFLSPIEEAELVFDTFVSGIDYLLASADIEKLLIPTSHGNHGRTGKKQRISSGARNSFEWGLYHRLRKHYAKEPRVGFQIADGYLNYVELKDGNGESIWLRFHHGDGIRYYGGVGGLEIPLNKSIYAWNTLPRPGSSVACPATCDFLGHWHQYIPGSRAVTNASLIGLNAYALWIKAKFEEPQQAFCMVDLSGGAGRRVFGHFPIRVT